jgi:hypothetical protein
LCQCAEAKDHAGDQNWCLAHGYFLASTTILPLIPASR